MSESTQSKTPVEFLYLTIRDTSRFTIGYAFLTSISIYALYKVDPLWGGLGLATTFGFGILMSQNHIHNENENEFDELATWKQLLLVGGTLLYINATILASGIVGGALIIQGFVPHAIAFALLYPVWEKVTTRKTIPLSVGGFLAALILLLIIMSGISSAARTVISSSLNNPLIMFRTSFRQIGKNRSRRLN